MAIKTSMNIKADPTLVGMAYKEAASKAPFSMEGMFEGIVQTHGEMMDSISNAFQTMQKELDKINDETEDTISKSMRALNDGTIKNEDDRQAQLDVLEGFRLEKKANQQQKYREWKAIQPADKDTSRRAFKNERKKKESEIDYKINRFVKDIQKETEDATVMLATIDDNLHDKDRMKTHELEFINQVGKYYIGEETSKGFKKEIIDGKSVFSFKYIDENGNAQKYDKLSISDIKGLVKPKNSKSIINANDIINDTHEHARTNPKATFEGEHGIYTNTKNSMFNLFENDDDAFSTVIRARLKGQKQSYIEAFYDPKSEISGKIFDVLTSFKDYEGVDKSGDGKINADDFKTPQNYMEFVKALTDEDSPNFDKQVAYEVAAEWYADTEARRAFGQGESLRKDKSGGTGGTGGGQYQMPGYGYVKVGLIDPQVKLLNEDPEDIPTQYGYNGIDWRKVKGQYQIYDKSKGPKGEFANTTKQTIVSSLKFNENVGYTGATVETKELTTTELSKELKNLRLEGNEDKALKQLQDKFPQIKDLFSIPLSPGVDKINFDGVNYNLEISKDVDKLKEAIENYDPLNPNKQ